MKRALFAVLLSLLLSGMSIASGIGIDVSGDYASEPDNDFDSTVGLSMGINVDFESLIHVREGSKFRNYSKNMKFRGDIGYFHWEDDVSGVDLDYTRIPMFIGMRYYYPVQKMNRRGLDIFGEGGGELSIDDEESYSTGRGKRSDDEITIGFALGGGIQYSFTDLLCAGAHLRYHAVSDDYFTLGAYIGLNFN